jgi:hypothetical protein
MMSSLDDIVAGYEALRADQLVAAALAWLVP